MGIKGTVGMNGWVRSGWHVLAAGYETGQWTSQWRGAGLQYGTYRTVLRQVQVPFSAEQPAMRSTDLYGTSRSTSTCHALIPKNLLAQPFHPR